MVQNPQFLINIRKNINANNPGYGKYYPKAVEKETITLRGLAKHMSEHQCVYSRDIIEGVLIKMASCMIELIAQGNPIKIDGLGIFWPTVESTKEGITRAALLEGKWNANTYVKGLHIRFRPEGVSDDDITSRTFKDLCSLSTYGVEEKIDLSSTTGYSSSRRRILNRREVNQDEETHHRDSGEGHSSRSHSLPHGHHNYVVHGPRSPPTLLNEHRESLSKVLVRNGKDFYYII